MKYKLTIFQTFFIEKPETRPETYFKTNWRYPL